MTIVSAFVPGPRSAAALMTRAVPVRRRRGLVRRVAAIVRLLARRRRARHAVTPFQELDHATLRELGLTDWHRAEVARGTGLAAMRHRTELDYLLSAASRFVVRGVDTAL